MVNFLDCDKLIISKVNDLGNGSACRRSGWFLLNNPLHFCYIFFSFFIFWSCIWRHRCVRHRRTHQHQNKMCGIWTEFSRPRDDLRPWHLPTGKASRHHRKRCATEKEEREVASEMNLITKSLYQAFFCQSYNLKKIERHDSDSLSRGRSETVVHISSPRLG